MRRFEALESRSMMTVTAVLDGTTLTITGTDGDDWISITEGTEADLTQRSLEVRSGWSPSQPTTPPTLLGTWIVADIERIVIDGRGGNDYIALQDFNNIGAIRHFNEVTVPALILGGDGDDQISGGWGEDTILGGDGDDEIYAGRGDDVIDGGAGRDEIYGWMGFDTIYSDDSDEIADSRYNEPDTIIKKESPTETISIGLAFSNIKKDKLPFSRD